MAKIHNYLLISNGYSLFCDREYPIVETTSIFLNTEFYRIVVAASNSKYLD